MRQKTLTTIATLMVASISLACVARGQTIARPVAIAVAGGFTLMSKPPGACGGDFGGPEGVVGLIARPWRNLTIEGNLRTARLTSAVCLLPRAPIDTAYDVAGFAPEPYLTSSLRFGYETPASLPLFRFTVGGGKLWGGHPSGFAIFGIAWSTRGPRTRFFVEAERTEMRLRGTERQQGPMSPVPTTTRSFVVGASAQSYRLGLEWPLTTGAR